MRKKETKEELEWRLTQRALRFMQEHYKKGLSSVSAREIAFYFHERAIHSSKSRLPDYKIVERLLGRRGLGIDAKSPGYFRIPTTSFDFIWDSAKGIRPQPPHHIDELCIKYGVLPQEETPHGSDS